MGGGKKDKLFHISDVSSLQSLMLAEDIYKHLDRSSVPPAQVPLGTAQETKNSTEVGSQALEVCRDGHPTSGSETGGVE